MKHQYFGVEDLLFTLMCILESIISGLPNTCSCGQNAIWQFEHIWLILHKKELNYCALRQLCHTNQGAVSGDNEWVCFRSTFLTCPKALMWSVPSSTWIHCYFAPRDMDWLLWWQKQYDIFKKENETQKPHFIAEALSFCNIPDVALPLDAAVLFSCVQKSIQEEDLHNLSLPPS